MRKPAWPVRVITASLLTAGLGSGAHGAEQTVDAFEHAQQAAWNAHDAVAYAAAFAPDADIITSAGWHWTGQTEAARNLGDGFKLIYAQARFRIVDFTVHAINPDLMSVSLRWSITGARTIEGRPQTGEQQGWQTQLLQRRAGRWSIMSQQDTLVATAQPSVPNPSVADAPPAPARFPTTPPPLRRCVLARSNGDCLVHGKAKPAPAS